MTPGNETIIKGLGVSEGVRIGRAFVYKPVRLDDAAERKTDSPELELERLQAAKERCMEDLERLVAQAAESLG